MPVCAVLFSCVYEVGKVGDISLFFPTAMAPMAICVQVRMQESVCVDSAGVDRMSTHRSDSSSTRLIIQHTHFLLCLQVVHVTQ